MKMMQTTSGNSIQKLRQNSVEVLAVIAIFISIGGVVAQVGIALISDSGLDVLVTSYIIIFGIFNGLILMLVRWGYFSIAADLMVIAFLGAFLTAPNNSLLLMLGLLAIISSVLLGNTWLFRLTNIIILSKLALNFVDTAAENDYQVSGDGIRQVIEFSTLVITSITVRFFVTSADQAASQSQYNADLLQNVSEIGQEMAAFLETQELLDESIERIRKRFNYYHVQVFLVDERREYVELRASTGQVGQRLIEQRYQLLVGAQNVISRVAKMGEPLTIRQKHMLNDDVPPSTRSRMVLPITDGESIIGVLDVQSSRTHDTFDTHIMQALQIVANQLGIAIRNARLFEAKEVNLEENKRLFLEAEFKNNEVELLNRRLTRQSWDEYMLNTNAALKGITLRNTQVEMAAEWTTEMIEAVSHHRIITRDGEKRVVVVPILLRGEAIGAIEIEASLNILEQNSVDLVKAVAERLALSLDNARLFEEAQEAAMQEQRINHIASRYQTASTVEDLLQITLKELSETLGAKDGMIRLGTLNSSNGHTEHTHNGKASS